MDLLMVIIDIRAESNRHAAAVIDIRKTLVHWLLQSHGIEVVHASRHHKSMEVYSLRAELSLAERWQQAASFSHQDHQFFKAASLPLPH